jgi:hypothetical protein
MKQKILGRKNRRAKWKFQVYYLRDVSQSEEKYTNIIQSTGISYNFHAKILHTFQHRGWNSIFIVKLSQQLCADKISLEKFQISSRSNFMWNSKPLLCSQWTNMYIQTCSNNSSPVLTMCLLLSLSAWSQTSPVGLKW